jgi:serine/threonine protein kinase/WD40 repeat protein
MERTPDGTPTVDLGSGAPRTATVEPSEISAFDPPTERFDTVGEIGRGGMGRVDDAYDRALDRPVAIKHMLSTTAVDLARFEREAKITARLEHPGIVPIHDAGRTAEGTPYYVMRRIDGQPLDQRVTDKLAERLALIPNVLAACDAVAFAHSRGIVHRDIKPTNILVGPFGETLVIDWGLAREISRREHDIAASVPSTDNLTRVGTVAGTPGFMAPEQARGESVDARADVFALGSTLFFVLAGALPYGVESATEMIGLVGEGRAADWNKVPSEVPPELVAIAKKAMAAEQIERYRDAGELAADLRQFITGNLVGAYEYSAGARLLRWVRRHRGAFAVALIALVVVAVGAVVSVRRIVSERDVSNHERELAEQRRKEALATTDLLTVKHALELADSDPVSAIAVLRTLPPDSSRWPQARIAAQAAFVKGIPFGYHGMRDAGVMWISADNRHLLVASWYGGQLEIIDLVDHSRVKYDIPSNTRGVVWVGTDHVALGGEHSLDILDLRTKQIRSLAVKALSISGNRDKLVWITTTDHRLLELDGPDGTLRELSTHVREASPDRGYTRAVILHDDNTVELWTRSQRAVLIALPAGDKFAPTFVIEGTVIAMLANDGSLRIWDVVNGKPVVRTTIASHFFILANIVGDKVILMSKDGIGFVVGTTYEGLDRNFGTVFPTQSGAVQLQEDGGLRIFDRNGDFLLGSHAAGIKRADVSADSRFVVGLTRSGDILAWELGAIRPIAIRTASVQTFARLSDHYLWFSNSGDGVSRLDIAKGTVEKLFDNLITGEVYVDPKERWFSMQTMNALLIAELATHRVISLHPYAYNSREDGLVLLENDGAIETWDEGQQAVVKRAHVRTPDAEGISAGASFAVVRYTDHVDRIDLDTDAVTRSEIAKCEGANVASDGTVWLETDTAVYRWPRTGAPALYPLPVHPAATVVVGTEIVFYTNDSITYVNGDNRTTIARPSKQFSWSGSHSLATVSESGLPSVVDLDTGLSFTVPTRAQSIGAYKDTLSTSFSDVISVWQYNLPRDPKSLQEWLRTITNAQFVPNTEAYAWP